MKIVTKLDETCTVGDIISSLAEKGKPVTYITDGPEIPCCIQKASVERFLVNLKEING